MSALPLKAPVVRGTSVGHRRALEDFVEAVDSIGLKPLIDRRYRLEEADQAFAHLDRGRFGEIVIYRASHPSGKTSQVPECKSKKSNKFSYSQILRVKFAPSFSGAFEGINPTNGSSNPID